MTICSCGYEAPSGCGCGFVDTESIVWHKVAGQAAQRQPVANLDPRTDNLASCTAGGLLVALPTRFVTTPSARVYRSTLLTTNDDVETGVSFDTSVFDTDTLWNGSNLFRVVTAGIYIVQYSVRWVANASGFREAGILVDGGAFARQRFHASVSINHTNIVSMIYAARIGTEFSFVIHQNRGGTLDTVAATATNVAYNSAALTFVGDVL